MTFQELYAATKAEKQTPTPAQIFIARCMEACKVSENTVRGWLCNSRRPDALAQEALAKEFGRPVDELFPPIVERDEDHHPYSEE